jgi:hypothetical protein
MEDLAKSSPSATGVDLFRSIAKNEWISRGAKFSWNYCISSFSSSPRAVLDTMPFKKTNIRQRATAANLAPSSSKAAMITEPSAQLLTILQ